MAISVSMLLLLSGLADKDILNKQDPHAEERLVSAAYSCSAPGETGLPLRLLHEFRLFIRDDDGRERPAGLQELRDGK